MRQYERSGVTIDQCTECRGIFLDRGELERLVDGETTWHGGRGDSPRRAAPYDRHDDDDDDDDDRRKHGYGYGHGRPYKKKRSFLEDLFD